MDHPYSQLTPEVVLEAVDSHGFISDGRLLALNSYENRVYQVGIEDSTPVIVKFYRPRRWQDPAFPKAFSWFNTETYWARHITDLREQFFHLQEAPLQRL